MIEHQISTKGKKNKTRFGSRLSRPYALGEFRLYNRALTTSERQALFTEPHGFFFAICLSKRCFCGARPFHSGEQEIIWFCICPRFPIKKTGRAPPPCPSQEEGGGAYNTQKAKTTMQYFPTSGYDTGRAKQRHYGKKTAYLLLNGIQFCASPMPPIKRGIFFLLCFLKNPTGGGGMP